MRTRMQMILSQCLLQCILERTPETCRCSNLPVRNVADLNGLPSFASISLSFFSPCPSTFPRTNLLFAHDVQETDYTLFPLVTFIEASQCCHPHIQYIHKREHCFPVPLMMSQNATVVGVCSFHTPFLLFSSSFVAPAGLFIKSDMFSTANPSKCLLDDCLFI